MTAPALHPSVASRLFVGKFPCGIVYADRSRERAGDYLRLAFVSSRTLELEWWEADMPPAIRDAIRKDAADLASKRGQFYQTTSSGQGVILGGAS